MPNNGEKFIVCNGDEGDPGAYMDRSVLEGDPHSVIEGMLIGAYAMGAHQGYFYIRAEYQLAVERVEQAIRQARRAGLLGKNILDSGFDFNAEVRLGAGAFVCGEETALIASIEGRRGTPNPRPPYPSVKGLWKGPTCINNVETLAAIPRIVRRGADWFAGIGTERSKGTKVFAITGKVKNSGLVEVPMGMTIKELVDDISGGTQSGKPVKAVQTGGPSGGVIPASLFDTPVSYEHLTSLGSIMGSGGLIIMEEGDSMVDIAKFYLGFCVEESCGKCAPCRIGGKQMLLLLEKISDGAGTAEDIVQLRRISRAMQIASLCGLGQTAPNPVLSTLEYFESEYRDVLQPSLPVVALTRVILDRTHTPQVTPGRERSKMVAAKTVRATIDGYPVEVPVGTSILDAARSVQVKIPVLCKHPDLGPTAACGLCIVKVKDSAKFPRACCTALEAGMDITTRDPELVEVRRTTIEMILSKHPNECFTCGRNGTCELQKVAADYGIREVPFPNIVPDLPKDDSTHAVVLEPRKCITCGRCVMVCQEHQNVWALSFLERGFETRISPAGDIALAESPCVRCGQCAAHCPTGAIFEYDETDRVWAKLKDPEAVCVVQIAPAVRVAIGEPFGLAPGANLTGQLYNALRRLGFHAVFDTNFGADVTIMEEAAEFVQRLTTKDSVLPMITTCCPSWVDYMEKNHGDMIPHFSSAKSPHEMLGVLTKTYYAQKMGIAPSKIFMVSIMPCTAKKYEITRTEEMHASGFQDVDCVLTTRELSRMIKQAGIDFLSLARETPDSILGDYSGAGTIFGVTGGVMEAALRSAYKLVTRTELEDHEVEFDQVRGMEGVREAEVEMAGKTLKLAVAHGLSNVDKVIDKIRKAKENGEEPPYHLIEVMACSGGCIGGGGQPYGATHGLLAARAAGLYADDRSQARRKSHENPFIHKLYDEFLGAPLGHKSHELLHTKYTPRPLYQR